MFKSERSVNHYSKQKHRSVKLNIFIHGASLCLIMMILITPETSFAQPLASGKDKFVGNVISSGNNIRSDFAKYWNQVTPENAGKWGSANPSVGTYNWGQLDLIYNYAVTNNFPFKHHALVWGQQYPSFVATLDSANLYQAIENWIKSSGQRYPKADMVDVVNEPLHSFTGTAINISRALGSSGTTGWDWVIKAFQLARKYWSPTTKLLINEYNIINDASATNSYINLINILKSRGLVDGIGIQAHGFEVDGPSLSTLKTNLDKLAATGLPIYISEFDINQADDNTQLAKYKSIFPLLYENPGVKGITLWGYVIYNIWQTNGYLINERNAERPALQWLRTYLAAPYRPTLISPNATINESLTPKLTWYSSLGAQSYHVQVTTSTVFSSTVLDTVVKDTIFTSKTLSADTRFFWRVSSISDKGESPFTDAFYFITKNIVDVKVIEGIHAEFKLFQNYPNPFNPATEIKYSIPKDGFISLKVYNLIGENVATIFEGIRQSGNYIASFNGSGLSSGVYLYSLKADNFIESKKFVLLK